MGCLEEVPGLLKVKWSLGPEDASSVAAANAMEVVNDGGGELLVGAGPGDMGEELELGPPPPRVQLEEVGQWKFLGGWRWSRPRRARPWRLLGLGPWRWMALSRRRRMVPQEGEAVDEETDSLLAHASPS